jgi:2-phosphoglycerate kinase
MHGRSWDLVLVGGAAGVGKTGVAASLARRFDRPLTAVDDFQVVLEQMTTPEQQPALHFWRTHPDPGALSPAEIHEQGLEILDVMRPALQAVIEDHLDDGRLGVMEGDFIHPTLADRERFGGRVRGVFLCETDAEQLVSNFLDREPGAGRQQLRAQVSALRSAWLEAECGRIGVPALDARPWDTLEQRVLDALS